MCSRERSIIDDLSNVIDTMDKAGRFIEDMDYEDFLDDEKTLFATAKAIELIGETLKHIPENIKDSYPNVPWADIYGMKNFLVHNYFASDSEEIWKTLKEDLPELRPVIQEILDRELQKG
ncbi:MAG: DUF86 domain-containing protein [Candidatus Aminicenantes bacterium]|nr:DUF86 domain-containing protein [Candidatus Aminicenantes bacterium]